MPRFMNAVAALALSISAGAQTLGRAGSAAVIVPPPRIRMKPEGKHIIQDVSLSNAMGSYTLRYDVVEIPGDPGRVTWVTWAPKSGYAGLGIAAPSMACWYNQGFFAWTLDDLNIQSYQAKFRIVREGGQDAMVEYVWDTPKGVVTARFAVTSNSDKLLFFGSYEPKGEVQTCKLRLMAYPATFQKPHARSVTTATRTLTSGSAELDLTKERWILLEDTAEGRMGDGSAGLLLGDPNAFAKVTAGAIGGYGEYIDIELKPGQRRFCLALYEFPGLPDPLETRAYFQRSGNAESAKLAAMLELDTDEILPPMPVDAQRAARMREEDVKRLKRPAEAWGPSPTPLDFPWADKLRGGPVRVALLAPRWAAYETGELARRLDMDVTHQYFDTSRAIASTSAWSLAGFTGIGSLGVALASREAARVCADTTRDVILITNLSGTAVPTTVRQVVLEQVRSGKGLMLTGGSAALKGWPPELTADPDPELVRNALRAVPWAQLPGLRPDEPGRLGDGPPLLGYRYGAGRVVVLKANISRYSALVPRSEADEGLEGATDRILAMNAAALLAAAGRAFPRTELQAPETPITAAKPSVLRLRTAGARPASVLLRIQDEVDNVVLLKTAKLGPNGRLKLPGLPGTHKYFADVLLRGADGECIGFASTALSVAATLQLNSLALSPSRRVHPDAVPIVDLIDGGKLTCRTRVRARPPGVALTLRCTVSDSFGRVLATGSAAVPASGRTQVDLRLQRPVTVCHQVDSTVYAGSRALVTRRDRFTIPVPYPFDDFTALTWSFPGAETVTRYVQRACYELGTDMMDLCHMSRYGDTLAAREYAVASRSGLRLIPYVTRLNHVAHDDNTLAPGLFDPEWLAKTSETVRVASRQAAPYGPVAYTLGDENYLSRGKHEACGAPETMVAYRAWLKSRYGTIAKLNAVWDTKHARFAQITAPMWIGEAAKQTISFAAWFDHRDFMDTAFTELHEKLAAVIRQSDPSAKVGWDGLLDYHHLAGYDFHKLTRNLELNQVYSSYRLQGELVRSFARPGAFTGEWANSVADKEDGYSAIGWHNLFRGHNSVWWWMSWGCGNTPFNPDGTVSKLGQWFFAGTAELRGGIGKLLLHGKRDNSGIAILYSQADMYAAELSDKVAPKAAFAGEDAWLNDLRGLSVALEDLGYQYRFLAGAELESDPQCLAGSKALFLPLATCLSDTQAAAIRAFVKRGGVLIADGRVGMLTENGIVRAERSLTDVFGVSAPSGLQALSEPSTPTTLKIGDTRIRANLLEPGLTLAGGVAAPFAEDKPVWISNGFGKGRGVLLNLPFSAINPDRVKAGVTRPLLIRLGALLADSGLEPHSRIKTDSGSPRCIEQTVFRDGTAAYLGFQQDMLVRALPPQALHVTLPEPAYVYDVRARRLMSEKRINTWDVEVSRGRPALFALLPYRVTAVRATVPARVRTGSTLTAPISVTVGEGKPGFHVVRADVFAPGSTTAHRQYSQNVACPNGTGEVTIPFALNDPGGKWTIELRDVASGTIARGAVELGPAPK